MKDTQMLIFSLHPSAIDNSIHRMMSVSGVASPTSSRNNERTSKRRRLPKKRNHVSRRYSQYYEADSYNSETSSYFSAPPQMLSALSSTSSEGFHTSEDETLSDIVSPLRCEQFSKLYHPPTDIVNHDDKGDNDHMNNRGSPAACIFVASLAKEKSDRELHRSVWRHFSQWGRLLHVKVLKDWMSRPYAFVQYAHLPDATVALQNAPGTLLDGRNIRCEQARVNRTICISSNNTNLPVEGEEVRSKLLSFGSIETMRMMEVPTEQGMTRYAYVKYQYRDDAIKAFLVLRGDNELQSKWRIDWAANLDVTASNLSTAIRSPQVARIGGSNHHSNVSYSSIPKDRSSIFIGNLFPSVTENILRERFSCYGHIVSVRIIRKSLFSKLNPAQERVFAFVKYEYTDCAEKAIAEQNQAIWNGKQLRVAYRENKHLGRLDRTTIHENRPHPPGVGFPASNYPYLFGASSGHVQQISVPSTDHRYASSDEDHCVLGTQQGDNAGFEKANQHLSAYFDYHCSFSEHDGDNNIQPAVAMYFPTAGYYNYTASGTYLHEKPMPMDYYLPPGIRVISQHPISSSSGPGRRHNHFTHPHPIGTK
ncbi:RNA-binding domain-containing protein [Lichtheimia hyalospora FSU 10163]|nr:RNA-binding domain-containing protein [Lichtheimia hyalospora FSU 10163]